MIFALELQMHARPSHEGSGAREINLISANFLMQSYELCIRIGLLPGAIVDMQASTIRALTATLKSEVSDIDKGDRARSEPQGRRSATRVSLTHIGLDYRDLVMARRQVCDALLAVVGTPVEAQ